MKFRKRLMHIGGVPRIFASLTSALAGSLPKIIAILDSSFVETYSGRDEAGSEYNGYKEGNGFKAREIIDFKTRFPLLQAATPGARAAVVWGEHLIRGAPPSGNVRGLLADKAYDGWRFVAEVKQKWRDAKVGIPVRRTIHERKHPFLPEVIRNRASKEAGRYLRRSFLNRRTEIERYFSRKKRVFRLGEERTRGLWELSNELLPYLDHGDP